MSTDAGGLEAGKVNPCAGKGCVGSDAILEDIGVEATLLLVAVEAVEAVEITDVVLEPAEAVIPPLAELELLLAICWNLPNRRLCSK